MSGRFAWVRVWPGFGWKRGECASADPVWVLIEEQADGAIKYAFPNLPAGTSRVRAVRLWKGRWPVEQGYQQMKEELGLDHFEGRSWRGFHHHAAMVMLAYGFLLLERERVRGERGRAGRRPGARKKGARAPANTSRYPAGVAAVTPSGGEARLRLLPRTAAAPDPGVTE
jgi:hypothetical protein